MLHDYTFRVILYNDNCVRLVQEVICVHLNVLFEQHKFHNDNSPDLLGIYTVLFNCSSYPFVLLHKEL